MNGFRRTVSLSLYLSAICLPLALFFIMGEASHGFEGEGFYERPAPSLAGIMDGSFQEGFERWFATRHPLRPGMVELYGAIDAAKDGIDVNFLKTGTITQTARTGEGVEPGIPEYALPFDGRGLREPEGYKGTAQVVIGKNGYLYENGYINEYFGYSRKYSDVTDESLTQRAASLKTVQDALALRDIAFCVVITPSKASSLPMFIPDWYTAKYSPAEGYARPYERFLAFLDKAGVFYVDSASLYSSLGLTNTFPKTGIHWNKLAAFETLDAVLAEYESQTGEETRRLAAHSVISGDEPPGFGNSERDIFGIVYAGKAGEMENAETDDAYYWHDAYVKNPDAPSIFRVTLQGGSFIYDLEYYLSAYRLADIVTNIRYNDGGSGSYNWERELAMTSYVLLELNEQFVYGMGGNAPAWGQADFRAASGGYNVIDALHDYLLGKD